MPGHFIPGFCIRQRTGHQIDTTHPDLATNKLYVEAIHNNLPGIRLALGAVAGIYYRVHAQELADITHTLLARKSLLYVV